MTGTVEGNVWNRRPELRTVERKAHKTIPNLYFEIGVDEQGNHDVKKVEYPSYWTETQILEAVNSRENTIQESGCKHCRRLNIKKQDTPKYQLLPGKRPVREKLRTFFR